MTTIPPILIGQLLLGVRIPWGMLITHIVDRHRAGAGPDELREELVEILDAAVRWDIVLGPGFGTALEAVDDDLIRVALEKLDEHDDEIRAWAKREAEAVQRLMKPLLRRWNMRRPKRDKAWPQPPRTAMLNLVRRALAEERERASEDAEAPATPVPVALPGPHLPDLLETDHSGPPGLLQD